MTSCSGLDGARVIEAVGDKLKNFAVGDEVLAMFASGDRGGSFRESAVIQETMVAKTPATWSFDDSSTLAWATFVPFNLPTPNFHGLGVFSTQD